MLDTYSRILTVNVMQFGFMRENGKIDVYFENPARKVSCYRKEVVCFVDLRKVIDRVPKKVWKWEWMKKRMPNILVRPFLSFSE